MQILLAIPVSRSGKMVFPDSMSAHLTIGRMPPAISQRQKMSSRSSTPSLAIWLIRSADCSMR